MNKKVKAFFRRCSALAVSGVMSFSALNMLSITARADFTDEIADLEYKQQQLAAERSELESKLAEYEEGMRESDEYLKIYDEKMKKQEEEIINIKQQISMLDSKIKTTRKEIDDKTEEIDRDIVEFKQRLRIMYMEGSDSLASILVGSTDFYDILVRTELMERVSRHDNEMIDNLNIKITDLNAEKAELEQNMTSLESKRSEAEDVLEDLRETYNNHAEMKEYYEAQAEASRNRTDEMRAEAESVEEDLAKFIRLQQEENEKKRAEEEARRKEEERKRKEEEERQRKEEEERRRKEEEERKQREEEERLAKIAEAEREEAERRLQEEMAAIEAARKVDEQKDEDEDQDYDELFSSSDDNNEDLAVKDSDFIDAPNNDQDTQGASAENSDDTDNNDDDGDDSYRSSGSSDLIWPCPTVMNMTDGYGRRTVDEEGGASEFHKGIDITKPGCAGEKIVAAASGTVITASNTGNGYGIHVVIDHGGKLATLYAHMSDCTVSVGDYVEQGQTIGYIGSTGQAYGNHLHFEVRVNGEHTNPLNYVSM